MTRTPEPSTAAPPESRPLRSDAEDAAEWSSRLLLSHYQHTPQAVISGMALSALIAWVLWGTAPHARLVQWLAGVETMMALRLLVAHYFLHGGGRARWSMRQWCAVAHVQTVLSGVSWGTLGLFYAVVDDHAARTALLMTLMGACAGSAALIGSIRGTLTVF
ncbi:MAG: hypothetical protein RJB37_3761, partial [Pseudomonadota bacterium]